MRKKFVQVFLLMLLVVLLPVRSVQAAERVTVQLPDFAITLNGMMVNNAYREYPFVVYQGVTYCPLTYYESRFLGLETEWSEEDGLTVEATDVICGFRDGQTKKRNAKTLSATVANYPITVNGAAIDNQAADYPVLVIRDAPYFPLSWQYANDAFHWTYHYDEAGGLVIDTPNEVMLPKAVAHFDNNSKRVYEPQILLDNGTLYYEGDDGGIYRTSLDDLQTSQKLYQRKAKDDSSFWPADMHLLDNYIWVACDGLLIDKETDEITPVNDDGLPSANYPYNDITVFEAEDKLFYVDIRRLDPKDGQHIEPGNLYVEENGERRSIGDARYFYGLYGTQKSTAMAYTKGALYLIATTTNDAKQRYATLCQVDLATNKTTELYHTDGSAIRDWAILDDTLYYYASSSWDDPDSEQESILYARTLPDGKVHEVDTPKVWNRMGNLMTVGNTLYISSMEGTFALHRPDKAIDLYGFRQYDTERDALKRWRGTRSNSKTITSNGYMIECLHRRAYDPTTDYRTIILDPDGQLVFRSADIVQNVTVDQLGNVAYTIEGEPHIYFGHIDNQ